MRLRALASILTLLLSTAGSAEPSPEPGPGGSLDAWRHVHELCEQAVKGATAADRIRGCEQFLEQYPDHKGRKALLKALVDSYLETGSYDPERVSALLEALAELDPVSYRTPLRLVDEYYVKYGLPLESARKLLDLSLLRREKEREKLQREVDPKRQRARERSLTYSDVRGLVLEGRLLLEHGRNRQALETLLAAKDEAAGFPRGIEIYEGAERLDRLSTGVLDSLELSLAAASGRLGRESQAREYLGQMLGFFSEKTLKGLRDEVLANLGLPPVGGSEVTTAPLEAADFTLKDLEGREVSLSDYRGKVVLISFWATWCYWCVQEIPVLRKFEDQYRDKGVIVLAVNTDSVTERAQIPPFIEQHNMPFKILLGEEEQLTGYEHSGLPTLYVVDREGRIALASVGYDAELKEKLETKIANIIEGEPTPDRRLAIIEQAPDGFGVIWQTDVEGDIDALAVAPRLGDRAGEIGAVGRQGLTRWAADGSHLGDSPVVVRWARGLRTDDLDGDGRREWILIDYDALKVFDDDGELYWSDEPGVRRFEIAAITDLDGSDDGQQEIVLWSDDVMLAVENVPESQLWRNEDFLELQALLPLSDGGLLAQADNELRTVTADGEFSARLASVPEGYALSGKLSLSGGRELDFFEGQWDESPKLDHDVDGDGRKEIVIVSGSGDGLVAYDAEDGSTLLRISGDDTYFQVAMGDLDGKPGDEVVLFVNQYGIVVLGRNGAESEDRVSGADR